ncbi:hypothetical protein [Alloscardovia criceti]|uniref:hypothetical protein n=1 Tax=Alloscardovia criceti TaxID=356828 RepID=UPI0003609E98|nr:hypothetical protein [Alloscardovia criceti]
MSHYTFNRLTTTDIDIYTYPNGDKLLTITRSGLLSFLLFGNHKETKVLSNTIDGVAFKASHHRPGSMKFTINGKKQHDATVYFWGSQEQDKALALYDELSDIIKK